MWYQTNFRRILAVCLLLFSYSSFAYAQPAQSKILRAGIIGLDTSHVIAFTDIINHADATGNLAKLQVVAGYPGGTDMPDSKNRVQKFTAELRKKGIDIVPSIPELLQQVDVVLLESVDGRIHLEEASQVIQAGKPLFIDKPVAGSLVDAIAIFKLAQQHQVPVWSASSIRFADSFQSLRNNNRLGDVIGCATWGPCKYQPDTPDMFFYGVHGIEGLFTVMGTGCESITRTTTNGTDLLVGKWRDGRIGSFRGIRDGKSGFGATAFGTKGIVTIDRASGYPQLCEQIAKFFQTNVAPVSAEETIEIFAFMEAADESKRQGGLPIPLKPLIAKATKQAAEKVAKLRAGK